MVQTVLRKKYANLSRQELADEAYELGNKFERSSRSCSQSVVAALREMLKIDKVVVKVATSSSGGQAAQAAGTCGGLIGGTMVLDYFFGRPAEQTTYKKPADITSMTVLRSASKIARSLYDKYIKEYGTILCPQIQTQLFGRSYVLSNPEELRKFDELGAHSDPTKCGHIVGNSARWVMEILIDQGLIKPQKGE